jgi:hypothetical protein
VGPLSVELDIESCLRTGQLELLDTDHAYLPGGCFEVERMIEFWEQGFHAAPDEEEYPYIRASGEMTWALRDVPGVELLVGYEAQLNRFLPKHPQAVLLCLYDLERFTDAQLLMGLLRTHPKVLLSGQVLDNPWYVDPDEYLADRP